MVTAGHQSVSLFLNRLPFAAGNPVFYTPLYVPALERFDFSGYDLVISTTSTIGHCLLVPPSTFFACYYHNINRHLYQPETKYKILEPLLKIYRSFDQIYARRPDCYLCNSKTVANRLQKHFHINPEIVYPGINTDYFYPDSKIKKQPYFLIVSRLVPHKRIDVAIRACHQLHLNLKIIGTGRQLNELKKIYSNSAYIEFLGQVDDNQLRRHYRETLALICPQTEDFGLTAIEAQACGAPVIAFRQGGLTETVLDRQTGVFFDDPTVSSLVSVLNNFPQFHFDSALAHQQAVKFSSGNFMLNFSQIIQTVWPKAKTITS